MGTVVSLGSINVDLVSTLDTAALDDLATGREWFPAAGATVRVETLPDEIEALPHEVYLGGKGANQAVAAARADADTTLLGKVGRDETEFGVCDGLRESGVDVERVGRSDDETGKAAVFVDEAGENRIAIVEGANGAVDEGYVAAHDARIRATDCLLLQNEIPVPPVLELLDRLAEIDDGPTVVVDPAPVDGAAPLVRHPAVDVVRPNEYEYVALGDALADFSGTVVQTRGSESVLVENSETFTVSPPPTNPVDTTGAGDTFNGYLAAELARGSSLRAAVEVATVAASMSIESAGAQASIPTLEAVRAYADAVDATETGDTV
ncbi:ribokinase [Halogranum gelatinilyticum]|uniref:Ribokinase n=1 Tax=Halogranum gelatinilyticum TaxID=660521 RepID=A0A1G9U3W7_9EURY|nr:PfkB family carbohydrate kinase [Halogranum gelatinilyticum]SDM54720.1 ribokinase [Halogranum gelatinilyticum]